VGDGPETALQTGFIPQGISADLIATLDGFSRTDVDTYAAESHARAAKAWAKRVFRAVRRAGDRPQRTADPGPRPAGRPGTSVETLAGLPLSFEAIGEHGGFDSVALEKYLTVERINTSTTRATRPGSSTAPRWLLSQRRRPARRSGRRRAAGWSRPASVARTRRSC